MISPRLKEDLAAISLIVIVGLVSIGGLVLMARSLKEPSKPTPIVEEWKERTLPDGTKWDVETHTGKIRPIVASTADGEPILGAGYSPVTGYETNTTVRISASATTIPVASVTDKAGNAITTSLLSSSSTPLMYFNIEPGTPREEPAVCTGISGLNLTGCTRGIAFQGSSLTGSSTIAQIHNAGSKVIMTNLGVMYGNEFVGVSGAQTIFDLKTFDTFPRTTSTTAIPTNNAELVTKYYADTVVSTGFTSANIDRAYGLIAAGTAPEKVRFNASSSGGLAFDPVASGTYINVSSTANDVSGGYMKLVLTGAANVLGKLYWDAASFLSGSHSWTGSNTVLNATNTFEVVNLSQLTNFTATGTAGMSITAGNLVSLSPTTSRLIIADSSVSSTAWGYIGVSLNTTSTNGIVTFARFGAVVGGFSGLSPGNTYYLSTGGGVSLTAGTIPLTIGMAYSTSTMQLRKPGFKAIVSGSNSNLCNGTQSITIPFIPTHVHLRCGNTANDNGASIGDWYRLSSGASSSLAIGGSINATSYLRSNSFSPCSWIESGPTAYNIGLVTTTAGFNLTCSQAASPHTVDYVAEYDEE